MVYRLNRRQVSKSLKRGHRVWAGVLLLIIADPVIAAKRYYQN